MTTHDGQVPLPRIDRTPHGFRLSVDGRPALLLGGQLHNSTPTSEDLPSVLARVRGSNASTVIASVSWSLIEPEEGRFDLSTVDELLAAARAAGLRLVVIWFGAFKNAGSTYAPTWVRADPARFPRAVVGGGRTEAFTYAGATAKPVLSVFSAALRSADEAAFVMLMRHLRDSDPLHTVVMVQVENEVGLLRDSSTGRRSRRPHGARRFRTRCCGTSESTPGRRPRPTARVQPARGPGARSSVTGGRRRRCSWRGTSPPTRNRSLRQARR